MPFIEGESLRARLAREGELPIGEAIRFLRDVVDALAYAHEHGVVHRDIKPDNVLLSRQHAMVTDFGVAKALSAATGERDWRALTSLGVALGTPAYMAPEQAAADPHADHRADIYAVGALAYEMLTGRPPFVGPSPQAMLAAQVTQAPQPITDLRADGAARAGRAGDALPGEEARRPVAERRRAAAPPRGDGDTERRARHRPARSPRSPAPPPRLLRRPRCVAALRAGIGRDTWSWVSRSPSRPRGE